MEDVARRSGVGRATLYRRVPTQAALLDAVVVAGARRYLAGGAQGPAEGAPLQGRTVTKTGVSGTFIREHAPLQEMRRTGVSPQHRVVDTSAAEPCPPARCLRRPRGRGGGRRAARGRARRPLGAGTAGTGWRAATSRGTRRPGRRARRSRTAWSTARCSR
nr:TetR/AcrR family transcriptional regulator [Mycobacterium avium]